MTCTHRMFQTETVEAKVCRDCKTLQLEMERDDLLNCKDIHNEEANRQTRHILRLHRTIDALQGLGAQHNCPHGHMRDYRHNCVECFDNMQGRIVELKKALDDLLSDVSKLPIASTWDSLTTPDSVVAALDVTRP